MILKDNIRVKVVKRQIKRASKAIEKERLIQIESFERMKGPQVILKFWLALSVITDLEDQLFEYYQRLKRK